MPCEQFLLHQDSRLQGTPVAPVPIDFYAETLKTKGAEIIVKSPLMQFATIKREPCSGASARCILATVAKSDSLRSGEGPAGCQVHARWAPPDAASVSKVKTEDFQLVAAVSGKR